MSDRFGYCIVSASPVRAENRDSSEMVSQLLFGELVTVEEVESPWCKITTYSDNYSGFIDIKHIHFLSDKEANKWLNGLSHERQMIRKINTPWGIQNIYRGSYVPFGASQEFQIGKDDFTFSDKHIEQNLQSPAQFAMEYLNTPYLWGGKTPFGIDCSGLTQTVYRFFDINLPRDASQQAECGLKIDLEDIESDDLAFFSNANGKIIHVGILDGNGNIIHASGFVRKDPFTNEGIIHSTTGQITHYLHSIKRM